MVSVRGLFKWFIIVKISNKSNNPKKSINSNNSNILNNSNDSTTLPMGSPLSGLMANLFMETLKADHYLDIVESHALWIRYANDVTIYTHCSTSNHRLACSKTERSPPSHTILVGRRKRRPTSDGFHGQTQRKP